MESVFRNDTVCNKNGCGNYEKPVDISGFPRDFMLMMMVNSAGNIFDLCGQAKAKIYIFDRFGKLLKEISPARWEINQQSSVGRSCFTVHYEEDKADKVFKSHFALKR